MGNFPCGSPEGNREGLLEPEGGGWKIKIKEILAEGLYGEEWPVPNSSFTIGSQIITPFSASMVVWQRYISDRI